MNKKTIQSQLELIKTISPEAMMEIETQQQAISKMTEILNEETQSYNQLHTQTKEKVVKGIEITHAQVMVLDKKHEFLLLHIQDIYQRIDHIASVLDSLNTRI